MVAELTISGVEEELAIVRAEECIVQPRRGKGLRGTRLKCHRASSTESRVSVDTRTSVTNHLSPCLFYIHAIN